METKQNNNDPLPEIISKPFVLTKKKIVIATSIFLLGFYCTAKMYSDIILSFMGINYSYQVTDTKSFKVLFVATIFATLMTLSLSVSFVVKDIMKETKKTIISIIAVFLLLQIAYQTVFFNYERTNEVNKGYREIIQYLQINSQQDFIKSDLYKEINAARKELDESKLINYINEKEDLLSIPNTLLTGLISVNGMTKKAEYKSKFNEIYKDKFVTRKELSEYKKLIATVEDNKILPDSLNEVVTTISLRGKKVVIRQ